MAVILAFPGCQLPVRPAPMPSLPVVFSPAWQAENLPLVDAALDLLSADDAEFARRCRLMADEEGRGLLAELSARLDQLGAHVGDVVQALLLTATRIRGAIATLPA